MKKILSTLIILIFSNLIIAQTTAIPDPNFEQALIDLGYDSGMSDGTVLTASIDTITSLRIDFKSINDLTGIHGFIALENLICNSNFLTNLDLSQNTAINYLNCNYNDLTTLNVSQNFAIKTLACNNNDLTNLDLSQNTALDSLDCHHNFLTILDVPQSIYLTYLNCGQNDLTTLDVSQNTALDSLNFDQNEIATIDLSQNTALTYLRCYDGGLTSLNLSQNTALEFILCPYNGITALDVSQNTALEFLGCYHTQLTILDVSQNTLLTSLGCFDNQLTSLDLSQNTVLEVLVCQENQLTSLDLSQNTALEVLGCHENQLTCLNVKNGNNSNFNIFQADQNPNLTCIEVDIPGWSAAAWTNIDAQTSFSSNCNNACSNNPVGFEEINLSNLSLYPNPTTLKFTINLGEIKKDINATLKNSLGQIILTQQFESTDNIDMKIDAPTGIYFLQLEVDGEVISKKIIKE
tara:strand:+ start:90 stop:1481 length:1392 start_codon:yes stop_codon:yes gene_type:complete